MNTAEVTRTKLADPSFEVVSVVSTGRARVVIYDGDIPSISITLSADDARRLAAELLAAVGAKAEA